MDVKIIVSEGGMDEGVNGVVKWGWHYLALVLKMTYDQAAALALAWIVWAEGQWLRDPRVVAFTPFTNDYEKNEWDKFDYEPTVMSEPLDAHIVQGVDVDMWGDEQIARWQPIIEYRAGQAGLDPKVVAAVIKLESNGQVDAESSAGAIGLMQVMPRESNPVVFKDRPLKVELLNPDQNVKWGCQILAGNLKTTQGDLAWALCYYYGASSPTTADGIKYLAAFRTAWSELWSGETCPIDSATTTPTTTPVTSPTSSALTAADLAALSAFEKKHQLIFLNPTAALQKQITSDGFTITGEENGIVIGGMNCVAQRAEHPQTGAVRVYWCKLKDYGNIHFWQR
jgi:hypothetical protein